MNIRKGRILLVAVVVVIAAVAVSAYFLGSGIPNIQFAGFPQGCSPMRMDTVCSSDSDCYASLPSDMPGDMSDVGVLSCQSSECYFTPYSCMDGMYAP